MRTFQPKAGEIERQWHVIDATDVVLGRLASQTARLLRGKHKAIFAPHVDTGDFVIIVNADKISLSGNKREKKIAYRHSGYPGGLTETPYSKLMDEDPEKVVEKAIQGMLPHNTLGRQMASKLKVYAGPEHPHAAQKPVPARDFSGGAVVSETVIEPETELAEDEAALDAALDQDQIEEVTPAPAPRVTREYATGPAAATGRRKEAIARVRLVPGTGVWKINGRSLEDYFPNKVHQQIVNEPFVTLDVADKYDVLVRVQGGGISGQAGAVRLGIARALIQTDDEARPPLKKAGFLTRDPRAKERKKYGLKKARKAPQYSKR